MRVAVAGVASEVRHSIVDHLVASGHDVATAARGSARPELDGAQALVIVPEVLPRALTWSGVRHRPGRDLLSPAGIRRLVDSAEKLGIRRVVHLSGSGLYADGGAEWITERSTVCVTEATEPLAVGEMAVQDCASCARSAVVLRLGQIVGDTPLTRWTLRAAAAGRGFGVGSPEGFVHVIHSDDVALAVLAALSAPSGVYNVGAAPVTRERLVAAYAEAAGRERGQFLGPLNRRLLGAGLDPLERSLRVSSDLFCSVTGWRPRHAELAPAWFEAADQLIALR